MSNLRELMKTGIFGKTKDGDEFVVVNDIVVYKSGEWDRISDLCEEGDVVKLVDNCRSFEMLEKNVGKVIYDCEKKDDENKEKTTKEMMDEINKLLDDVKRDAKSKGFGDKEASAIADSLFAAASFAALGEMLSGFDKR